ncbi:MAG: hypothetical protein CMI18_10765 [Opitutaceae bacterium]|nr:hypothetical protein [Opitutaceae bacterium]|tara:strand:- start:164 stop:553 length:390 start_codon:yes stop_codon:yes gene_type:complete
MLTRRYSWEERLDRARVDLGTNPQFVLFFRDLHYGSNFPTERVQNAHARGMTPVISLEISRWGDTGYLDEVVKGEFDEYFREWSENAKECGLEVMLRFGFEMNGDWFPRDPNPKNLSWHGSVRMTFSVK